MKQLFYYIIIRLTTRHAIAMIKIAPASYNKVIGSMPFPCKIINLEIAVIAINKGNVIGILLLI